MAATLQTTFSIVSALQWMRIFALVFVPKGPIDNISTLFQATFALAGKHMTNHCMNQ